MNNPEINSYDLRPLWDEHIHTHEPYPVDQTVEIFKALMQHFNYEKIVLNALPSYGYADSFKALYVKSQIPGVYVNAGLSHYHDERDNAEAFLEQAKAFYAMGCDGFKMLEGKPDTRKADGIPLDSPVYDKFYGFLQENNLPLLMHLGDPWEFWDIDNIPKWALERGWLYDETFVPLEGLRAEVEGFLTKFPRLKLTLAHFYFMSHDYDYAVDFMERFPNVCIDITPGSEMYVNFETDLPKWKAFFEKYADRILYGSDRYNHYVPEEELEVNRCHAINMVRSFLEKENFFCVWKDRKMSGFALSKDVTDKIYYKNAERIYGTTPRSVNMELLKQGAKKCLETDELSALDRQNLETILHQSTIK